MEDVPALRRQARATWREIPVSRRWLRALIGFSWNGSRTSQYDPPDQRQCDASKYSGGALSQKQWFDRGMLNWLAWLSPCLHRRMSWPRTWTPAYESTTRSTRASRMWWTGRLVARANANVAELMRPGSSQHPAGKTPPGVNLTLTFQLEQVYHRGWITPVLRVCRYSDRSHFEATSTAAVHTISEGFRLEFPYTWTVATDFLPVLDPSPTFGNHAIRITASINRMNHAWLAVGILLEFCTLILNSWI